MENITSFLGGIIALAVLGLLLFFELARESMLFVYVIYVLIILVAGAMVISIRGSILSSMRSAGNAGRRPKPREPETETGDERKIERFFKDSKPLPGPEQLKNPKLKDMMKRLKGDKPKGKFRFSGLGKRLRRIRMPRPRMPKIKIKKPGKPGKGPQKKKPIKKSPEGQEKKSVLARAGEEKMTRERPEKTKPRAEAPESCQICGSREGLKMHYIVPPERGGKEGKDTILLCKEHRKQAEEGMYSENLLRKLRGS